MSDPMDDLIRDAAGYGPPERDPDAQPERPKGGQLDGGARSPVADEPPSMDALLRASVEERHAARARRAAAIDQDG
jgi:hypothetical protein